MHVGRVGDARSRDVELAVGECLGERLDEESDVSQRSTLRFVCRHRVADLDRVLAAPQCQVSPGLRLMRRMKWRRPTCLPEATVHSSTCACRRSTRRRVPFARPGRRLRSSMMIMSTLSVSECGGARLQSPRRGMFSSCSAGGAQCSTLSAAAFVVVRTGRSATYASSVARADKSGKTRSRSWSILSQRMGCGTVTMLAWRASWFAVPSTP